MNTELEPRQVIKFSTILRLILVSFNQLYHHQPQTLKTLYRDTNVYSINDSFKKITSMCEEQTNSLYICLVVCSLEHVNISDNGYVNMDTDLFDFHMDF